VQADDATPAVTPITTKAFANVKATVSEEFAIRHQLWGVKPFKKDRYSYATGVWSASGTAVSRARQLGRNDSQRLLPVVISHLEKVAPNLELDHLRFDPEDLQNDWIFGLQGYSVIKRTTPGKNVLVTHT